LAPLPDLANYFSLIFSNFRYSDLILCVGDQQFPVHKIVLFKRCEYFRALLHSGMKESFQQQITLNDVTVGSFSCLLQHIYNFDIHFPAEQSKELIVMANQFLLWDLKRACEAQLIGEITVENVADLYSVAKSVNAVELKEISMEYIRQHFTEVCQTQNFKEEIAEDFDIVSQLPPELLASFMFDNYDSGIVKSPPKRTSSDTLFAQDEQVFLDDSDQFFTFED